MHNLALYYPEIHINMYTCIHRSVSFCAGTFILWYCTKEKTKHLLNPEWGPIWSVYQKLPKSTDIRRNMHQSLSLILDFCKIWMCSMEAKTRQNVMGWITALHPAYWIQTQIQINLSHHFLFTFLLSPLGSAKSLQYPLSNSLSCIKIKYVLWLVITQILSLKSKWKREWILNKF